MAATAVGLLALEGAARVLHVPSRHFVIPMRSNCLRRSASLGTEFRPSCPATWHDEVLTGGRATTFRTNSLGLRDSEIEDDGADRLLAIGDSCTWGWEVAQDEAYPQVLQRLLERQAGPRRYRVINGGTPGYASYQGLVYLRERGLALRPAVVMFGYWFNDQLPTGDVEEALALQQRIMPLVKLDDRLLEYSLLWRAMRSATLPREGDARVRVSPDKYRRNLAEIIRLTREQGARPFMVDFSGPDYSGEYARIMAELSDELAVPTVIYKGPLIDIVHPTREGHAQLAEMILEQLKAERYVSTRRPAD